MDKLKPIIKIVKKYHIWVLCMVIIGTAVGALFAGSGKLAKSADTTARAVKGVNSKVAGLAAKPKPPNQSWIAAKDAQIIKERERIERKWDRIHKSQQQELLWPDAVGGQEFADKIEEQTGLSRLEKVQEEQFEKYAAGAFDEMVKIVKAEPRYRQAPAPVEEKVSTTRGAKPIKQVSRALPPVGSDYVVGWAPASQSRIAAPLLRWGNEVDFGAPTARRAQATQRDLWIYETLLKAIAATNGDATANYMARVKYILDLRIGGDVANSDASESAEEPATGAVAASGQRQPVAATPRPVRQTNLHAGIAESVPIRMDLIVDQRHLGLLFAKCANRNLPIEITSFTARYRSRSGKDRSDNAPQATTKRGGAESPETGVAGTVVDNFDMYVSIIGKVHFYKEANPAMLGGPRTGP